MYSTGEVAFGSELDVGRPAFFAGADHKCTIRPCKGKPGSKMARRTEKERELFTLFRSSSSRNQPFVFFPGTPRGTLFNLKYNCAAFRQA